MTPINWHALTLDLEADDRGPIELAEALRVVDDYASRLKPFYESGEEAMAESVFVFCRIAESDYDYIRVCLHTLTDIAFSVQLPVPPAEGEWRHVSFQCERTLDSLDSLKDYVRAYFTLSADAFKAHLQAEDQT